MKNKNIIYISIFLFLLLLTGCTKKHTHNYSLEWEWGEDVVAIFKCECGESTQKLLANTEEEIISEADCLQDGKVIATAKVMFNNILYEKTKIITISKIGHNLVSHESKVATCTEHGWEAYEECTRCDYTTYKEISALNHDFVNTIIEPGPTTEGYVIDSCSFCDYSYKHSYTPQILKLELEADYYHVTGVNYLNIVDIIIPKMYNDLFVKVIGNDAFRSCTSLTSITIPNSVTSIGSYAFYNCESLTSITIPNSVTSIGSSAFESCTNLTSITIPNSVTSIGYYTFYNCESLTSITIPDSVTSIGYCTFYNCESLTSINVSENNNYYKSIDGNLYSKDGKTLEKYSNGKQESSFVILDSVTSIVNYAFDSCTSLTSITIPDSVTSIGHNAFYGCTSLTSINVSENNNYYKSIDGNLYSKDGKTLEKYSIGKQESSFVIPNSVTSIGGYAFAGCTSLTNIIIPDSVTSIGNDAFYSCTSLTIYCESTSKPSGWAGGWNPNNRPVVWGY